MIQLSFNFHNHKHMRVRAHTHIQTHFLSLSLSFPSIWVFPHPCLFSLTFPFGFLTPASLSQLTISLNCSCMTTLLHQPALPHSHPPAHLSTVHIGLYRILLLGVGMRPLPVLLLPSVPTGWGFLALVLQGLALAARFNPY